MPTESTPAAEAALAVLGRSSYVLLTTYRKDGTPVPTAVWVVRDGDELKVWTNGKAGKIKRLRRTPAVEIAPCTRTGVPTGEPVRGTGRVLDGPAVEAILPLLKRKYPLYRVMHVFGVFAQRLGIRERNTGGIAISLS